MSLEKLIEAVVNRDGNGGGESLIVANHLAQLKLFGARGIELYPVQDPKGVRKKFLTAVWKYNRMDMYLDYIWDLYLSCGEILFYLRPTGKSYEISWFHGGITDPNPEFKAYYKPGGRELERVIIAYPYKVVGSGGLEEERWVKLSITAKKIDRRDLNMKPNLNASTPEDVVGMRGAVETVENTLGFIPCVVIPNHPTRPGQPGTSEFHWLKKPLERHDEMLRTINRNLSLFANPTLVTTRSRGEVMEGAGGPGYVPTIASQSGYYPSTNRSDPRERSTWEGGEKVASVVGGVGGDERFGYIQVDPVSGDQNLYQKEYREQLHTALGGTDPLGIRSGATAYEVKVRSGQTAATARKKCLALYDYGLCRLFEMCLQAEEEIYRQSLFAFLKENKKKDFKKLETPDQLSDEFIQALIEQVGEPPGLIGLTPLGDRTIEWRFTSEIFPDTSREILDKSIVGRNLAEAGINTEYVLRFLFPDKTEKEINAMQSGNFSYRTAQNKVAAINQLLGLYQSFLGVPDPQDPSLPLAVRLDPTPLLEQALTLLAEEFSYGNKYDPADELNAAGQTNNLNIFTNQQSDLTNNGSSRQPSPDPGLYANHDARGSVAAAGLPVQFPGFGASNQPTAGYSANTDYGNPLPTPGGTVARVPQQQPGGYGVNAIPNGLPADIAVSPELWSIFANSQQQPGGDGTATRSGAKSKPKRGS